MSSPKTLSNSGKPHGAFSTIPVFFELESLVSHKLWPFACPSYVRTCTGVPHWCGPQSTLGVRLGRVRSEPRLFELAPFPRG